jgi:hypothetical protein
MLPEITMPWDGGNYWLTRVVFQRSLGAVYFIAFLCAWNEFKPLLGEHGLLPVPLFVKTVSFRESPSLFFLAPKDWAFVSAAAAGLALSVLAVTGLAERYGWWFHVAVWALLWILYLSFVNVGQIFYGFGWEILLLEAGFLAIFLGPASANVSLVVIYLIRWLEFRVMFGAGLIKLRGDPCWRDFTCLDYYYETQPIPNPLSWYFHRAPAWFHRMGVGFNHFSELLVPFCYFLPQPIASIAALITILFQGMIFVSGNLSWLNVLTMILAIPAIDGRWFSVLLSGQAPETATVGIVYRSITAVLAVTIGILSIQPVLNMMSTRQIMNTSYEPLHLVGTYGAFGSITRQRFEIVVEGTSGETVTAASQWKEYEFRGKPTDIHRMPPQIAPYHLRLDWLMWFAAMSRYNEHPWFVNFMAKLLENDKAVLGLLASNPFPDRPPRFVRAELYTYRFADANEHRATGQWWTRELAGEYFPAVSLDNADLRRILQQQGWLPAP